MNDLNMENQLSKVIEIILNIQEIQKFPKDSQNYNNLFQIIKGIFDEAKSINISYLNALLLNFNKKNLDKYNIIYQLLKEMKNVLATPINQLIFQIINSESNSKYDIVSLQGDRFLLLIKNLCKISHEFVLNFICTIPGSNLNKTKINGCIYSDVLNAIFANKGSINMIRDNKQVFINYLEIYAGKNIKESEKFIIFQTLLKILYNHNKKELKKLDIFTKIINDTGIYFNEIKNESTFLNIINKISNKFLKNKKIPVQMIALTQGFLDHKNINLVSDTIIMYFELVKKKILAHTSLYDLFSTDKKKYLRKHSFLFNCLLLKYESMQTNKKINELFINNFIDLFESDSKNSQTIIILFFISLSNIEANNIMHKLMMKSLDTFYNFLNNAKRYIDDENPVDSDMDIIISLFTENMLKHERLEMILNNITEQEKALSLRQAFIIYFSEDELVEIIDFGGQALYVMSDNCDFIQTILSVVFYYIYLRSNSKDKGDGFFDVGNRVLDFIKLIIEYVNTPNKSTINYIRIMITNLYNYAQFKEKIRSILKSFTNYCFAHYKISIKILATLYIDINRINDLNPYSLPIDFEEMLFDKESKKIALLKFINDLLSKDLLKYNHVFKYKSFILNNIETQVQNDYKLIIDDLDDSEVDDESIREYKHLLTDLILLRYEILTFEFYLSINEGNIEEYTSKLFIRLYALTVNKNKNHSELKDRLKIFLNNLNINKCINLIFRHINHEIGIKQKNLIQFSNMALYNEITVRDHFLKKLETKYKKMNSGLLVVIPICVLFFNDPDKFIKKRANILCADFCRFLVKNFENKAVENRSFKYLPEFYVSYILMYFIFNENLNKYFKSNHLKYFESILISYLKIVKKVTYDKYDSDLLIQNILKIKKSSLKSQKVVKHISAETYLYNSTSEKVKNLSITSDCYEFVKNELCDLTIRLINREFMSKYHHELKYLDQSIFNNRLSETHNNIDLSILKTDRKENRNAELDISDNLHKVEAIHSKEKITIDDLPYYDKYHSNISKSVLNETNTDMIDNQTKNMRKSQKSGKVKKKK